MIDFNNRLAQRELLLREVHRDAKAFLQTGYSLSRLSALISALATDKPLRSDSGIALLNFAKEYGAPELLRVMATVLESGA